MERFQGPAPRRGDNTEKCALIVLSISNLYGHIFGAFIFILFCEILR